MRAQIKWQVIRPVLHVVMSTKQAPLVLEQVKEPRSHGSTNEIKGGLSFGYSGPDE